MLQAVVTRGSGRRAALERHPVAGKTGTTQDYRDAWFAGYTSYLTAAVWVGNDNGEPMRRAAGSGLPAEIWRRVMQSAHVGKPPMALPGSDLGLMARPADTAQPGPVARAFGTGRLLSEPVTQPADSPAGRVLSKLPASPIPEDFIIRAIAESYVLGGQGDELASGFEHDSAAVPR
jgi:membrane peptidoglycan carboxypeptidase